jgi:hypothetical protein
MCNGELWLVCENFRGSTEMVKGTIIFNFENNRLFFRVHWTFVMNGLKNL